MSPDEQPTVPTAPPNGSRSGTTGAWAAPTVADLQAKLPEYEVLEILGRGGMGAVYKARQQSLKRMVAIKILPLGTADDDFKFVERFHNEAQTMAAMNHPAIVSVYDFGETPDGLLYFVMEFVDGTDLHKMIQASGRLSGEYALSITAHVCDALAYAHKRGVIHRDIKPANILIDQEGHIKVADFGLAKMHDPGQTSGLTRTNMAMGTPDYVAPEVLVTGMVADHRADIYAVGVMLYQMLTGEVPRGMFKLPSRKGIGSDERFDAIICKAMEQDREERYQSAMDVREALDLIATTPHQMAPAKSGRRSMLVASIAAAVAGLAFIVFKPASTPPVVASPGNLESWTDQLKKHSWEKGWLLKDGELRAESKTMSTYFGRLQDGAVRVRLRKEAVQDGAPSLQVAMRTRFNDPTAKIRGTYQFQIYPGSGRCNLIYLSKDPGTDTEFPPAPLWNGKTFPADADDIDLEFRAQGNELSFLCAGKLIASVRDSRVAWGWCMIAANPGVAIRKLETTGILPSGAMIDEQETPLPQIKWRDVTDSLREQARSKSEVELQPDALRLKEGKPSVKLDAGALKSSRFALKASFKSQMQLGFNHAGGQGFDFVLCQRQQVIFNTYKTGAQSALHLRPSVRLPASHDPDATHELIVIQDDQFIRAWLDGRFLGEARSDTPKDSSASFMLVASGELISAAVGDLSAG